MIISVELNNRIYKFDAARPLDISIPLDFYGVQPNAYGVERAESKACEAEGIVGDTRRGGSCNFEQVKFIPHCNGTHTECAGHITRERISVNDCLKDSFVFARLISVAPEKATETVETYVADLNENDKLITRNSILRTFRGILSSGGSEKYTGNQELITGNLNQSTSNEELQTFDKELRTSNKELRTPNKELQTLDKELRTSNKELRTPDKESQTSNQELQTINQDLGIGDCEALIIRTIPNDELKLSKTYLKEIPPFFSIEAMRFIAEIGVRHLLVDLPSIDRIFDEGRLSNHRIFWNVEQGSFKTSKKTFINNTITELIYVPNEIEDGDYLLNLQIAPFVADAAPSRPVIFRLL